MMSLTESRETPIGSTLLMLVQSLGAEIESDDEVANRACELIRTGRVVLTGNFRGATIELPAEG